MYKTYVYKNILKDLVLKIASFLNRLYINEVIINLFRLSFKRELTKYL